MFAALMEQVGVITREWVSIVDASFVDVPKQRNNRDENKKIKEGDGEELWQDNVENKRCQKDIDARWTEKTARSIFDIKTMLKLIATVR